jgi:tRNA pseudouridine55 synthase
LIKLTELRIFRGAHRFEVDMNNKRKEPSGLNGILVIDKPEGLTSHDVVARARRLLHEKRVGHTGTLDPFATGVLILMIGQATRLAQFLNTSQKEYEAVIRFGYSTDTGDLTGSPIGPAEQASGWRRRLLSTSPSVLESAMNSFRGEIEQIPPMYSAKKIGGKKLYELARKGEEIERKPVRIRISAFEIVKARNSDESRDSESPFSTNPDETLDLPVRVVCSAGTYVRTLAEDLGKLLGVGAHLSGLRRTRAGNFRIESSVTLDDLSALSQSAADLAQIILSPGSALPDMPFLHLSKSDALRARHGGTILLPPSPKYLWQDGEYIRLHSEDNELISVGVFGETANTISPRVVLAAGN